MSGNERDWIVAGASVRGTSHERHEQDCQDAHLFVVTEAGELIVAVADGTGSAKYSEEGATTAVQAAVDFLEARVSELYSEGGAWEGLLRGAAAHALKAVKEAAETLGTSVRELSSTLLLVIATRDKLFALQIGDGAIVRETPDGPEALFKPTSGEYINESVFLVSKGAIEQAKITERSGPAAPFAVFSDGLQMLALKMPAGLPEPGFFLPLFKVAKKAGSSADVSAEINAFLRSSRVRDRADDDLTLVLATPRSVADAYKERGEGGPSSRSVPVPQPVAPKEAPAKKGPNDSPQRPSPPNKSAAERSGAPSAARPHPTAGGAARAPSNDASRAAHRPAEPPRTVDAPRGIDRDHYRASEGASLLVLACTFGVGMMVGVAMTYLLMREDAAAPGSLPSKAAVKREPERPLKNQIEIQTQPRGEWGSECGYDGDCPPLLTCTDSGCRTKVHLGEPCGKKDMCVAGAACAQGVCQKSKVGKRKRDEPCAHDEDCASALWCVHKRCVEQRRGAGEPCAEESDCDDAYALACERGRCQPRWP